MKFVCLPKQPSGVGDLTFSIRLMNIKWSCFTGHTVPAFSPAGYSDIMTDFPSKAALWTYLSFTHLLLFSHRGYLFFWLQLSNKALRSKIRKYTIFIQCFLHHRFKIECRLLIINKWLILIYIAATLLTVVYLFPYS